MTGRAPAVAHRRASALFTHDAAIDEHHDRVLDVVVVHAISSGDGKGLTLLECLTVSRSQVGHHVAHTALLLLLLLCESGASDADCDECSNCQCLHDVSHSCDVARSCDVVSPSRLNRCLRVST